MRPRPPSRHRAAFPVAAWARGLAWRMAGLLAAGGALVPANAAAQRSLGTVKVEAEREPEPEDEAGEATQFVSVVRVDGPTARAASVADLIEREPGVRVRAAGGPGSFTSVSLRGSEAAQVAVFLDGVPLGRASSAAVDLSQIPADAVERIEIHRGLPPPELSGQAFGGVINIITRKGARAPAWRGSLGVGSFGTRSAHLGYGFGTPRLRVDVSLGYHGSRGNFTYFDNNGTPFTPSDDRTTTRQNNAFDQLNADLTLGVGGGRGSRYSLGVHGFWKGQGVPGRGSEGAETERARLDTGRLVIDGTLERGGVAGGAADLRLAGWLLLSRLAFNNRDGEPVGAFRATRTDGENLAGGIEARLQMAAGTHELVTGQFSLTVEQYTPRDLLDPPRTPEPSNRLRAELALFDDVRLLRDRLALLPSLRLMGASSRLGRAQSTIGPQAAGSDRVDGFVVPQLGVRLRLWPALALKGSVGRFVRWPTTLELFGDGATFLPRPSLLPETSTGGEVGLVIEGRRRWLAATAEAAFYGRTVDNYIALVGSHHALAAANLGDRRILGAEATLKASAGEWVALSAAYGFTHAITESAAGDERQAGRAVPGVPRHKLDLRADLTLGPVRLFYELGYTSEVWLDPQNVPGHAIPGRALSAVGGRAGPFPGLPLTITVEVRNLADLRVVDMPLGGDGRTAPTALVDFYDYPLPGRAFYLTLAWRPGP